MVKRLVKFMAYTTFFISMLLLFLPKENLYYLLEQQLSKYDVVIDQEELQDNLYSFEVHNAKVYVKNILAAKIYFLEVKPFIVYNTISLENVYLSSMAASFIPQRIDKVTLSYTILHPTQLSINAQGDFGSAEGEISLVEQKLFLRVHPSKKMRTQHRQTLRQLKKQPSGEYSYEQAL